MKDNKLEKLEKTALRISINNTLSSLTKAQELAVKRDDMEALIAIAERWVTIAEKMKSLDQDKKFMLGFSMEQEEEPDEHQH